MKSFNRIFEDRWGCDLARSEGLSIPLGGLVIRALGSDDSEFDGTISRLKLSLHGRWGNYVYQLIYIFFLAEKLGCRQVLVHSTSIFALRGPVLLHGIAVETVQNAGRGEGYELESVFFDMSAFRNLMSDLDANRYREIALKYVRPLLSTHAVPATNDVDPGDLVIHIRSGDIFETAEGAGVGMYVQPPLSFYTKVARTFRKKGTGRAFIIAENTRNPVILPLIAELQALGYAVTARLQHDFGSDLSHLLAARSMVFGNGTLGIAAALLSEAVAEGYFFRRNGTGTHLTVDDYLGDFIEKHYLFDEDEHFTRRGEWSNTFEQRQLMLSFPEERVGWEREPLMKDVALDRPARQSSVSLFSQPNESARAVDGTFDGDFAFHTSEEHMPWWEVELEGLLRIERIVVHNRRTVPERAYFMQVLAFGRDARWRLVHDQGGRAFDSIEVPAFGLEAKAIRIQLSTYGYLHLRKVEVHSVVLT